MNTKRNPIQICLLVAVLWPPLTALAAPRIVTSLDDGGAGTLRDTIAASAAGDDIVFATNGTINLTNGELLLGRDLTITGPGALNLTVSGNSTSRVFEIATNVAANISGLTIYRGAAVGTNGVEFGNPNNIAGGSVVGGGILNSGTLILSNCRLSGNLAEGGDGGMTLDGDIGGPGGSAFGGGIFNYGTLALTGCTLDHNEAAGGDGGDSDSSKGAGGQAVGGGIASQSPVALTNCTFFGNVAAGGTAGGGPGYVGGGAGDGGALWSTETSVVLVNCTISGNGASGGNGQPTATADSYPTFGGAAFGGGLALESGSLTMLNTIVAADSVTGGEGTSETIGMVGFVFGVNGAASGPEVSGTVTSLGNNLIDEMDGGSGWVGSDLTGTTISPLNPQLGLLQNNGGPTPTLALLANSPAIDAGNDAVLATPYNLATDQRGMHRPNGFHVDIGSFEFGGTELVTTLDDNGLGSLRQAIASANPGDRITFAPLVIGTIVLNSGELLVTNLLNIVGPGATTLTINANNSSRVLHVRTSGSLNLFGLTLANGSTTGLSGSNGMGGGLFNEGFANLNDCVISNSSASGGPGLSGGTLSQAHGGAGAGGGIYNSSVLSLLRCTLNGNKAEGGTGGTEPGSGFSFPQGGTGGAAFGAGVANTGIAILTNCTLAGNAASAGQGGQATFYPGAGGTAHGAGLNAESGSVTLTSCTISSNQSVAGNGGMGASNGNPGGANSGGLFSTNNVLLQNCLIAGNQATNYPDVSGIVQSGGFNLVGISDGSAGWLVAEAGNLGNSSFPINPKLGPLQNNGGTTPTMALLNGSPALDQGNSSGTYLDQRGYPRIFDINSVPNSTGGDGSDIGAFEASVAPILTPIGRGGNPPGILLTGSPGWTYAIQASTNVTRAGWTSLITNASPFTLVDTNAGNFSRRFYRGVSSP